MATRAALFHRGFALLDGILTPMAKELSRFFRIAWNMYVDDEQRSDQEHEALEGSVKERKAWSPIWNDVNRGARSDEEDQEGRRRMVTTRDGVGELLLKKSPSAFFAKLLLDACVGGIIDQLGTSSDWKSEEGPLKLPVTGGRLILTEENCSRQSPHTDFSMGLDSKRGQGTEEEDVSVSLPPELHIPTAFAVATGPDPATLLVWPYSHAILSETIQSRGATSVRSLAPRLPARKVVIPPFSVLLARGDLVHAGTGGHDRPEIPHSTVGAESEEVSEEFEIPLSMRYHVYAKPVSTVLNDEVHVPHVTNSDVDSSASEGDGPESYRLSFIESSF